MITIIIPVYNVASYLAACIDSILRQHYTDWELLLIDDGSTDSSGKLCDTYAAKDARIHCFHQANGGVGRARNTGIEHAKGEWITFIDGDDWVSDDYLANLMEPISNHPHLDFVHCGCLNQLASGEVTVNQQYECYLGSDPLYLLTRFRGLAVSKLFKKSLIDANKIQFDTKVSIAEDYLFTLDYLLYVQCYCFIESTGYYYRHLPSSATKSAKKIPYDTGVHQIEHNIHSLRQYLTAHSISDAEASLRWKHIADNLFFLIRNNGWLHLDQGIKIRMRNILCTYPLIDSQLVLKRKVYLWAFKQYISLISASHE